MAPPELEPDEPEELDELEAAPELGVDPDDPELLPDALAPALDAEPELPEAAPEDDPEGAAPDDAAPELDARAPAPLPAVCTQARAPHAARKSDRGRAAIRQKESQAAGTGQVRRGAPAQVQPYFVIVPPNRRAYRSASSSPPRSRPDAELTSP